MTHDSQVSSALRASEPFVSGCPPYGRIPAYMRRVRELRGLSLRDVERRTREAGRPIDNSELSKFENGKRGLPFQKFYELSSVYGIPLQCFDELKDLDTELAAYAPVSGNVDALVQRANALSLGGRMLDSYRLVEHAVALHAESGVTRQSTTDGAFARILLAAVLIQLGKNALAEQELKQLLRVRRQLRREDVMRGIAVLGLLHSRKGEPQLARVYACESRRLALACSDRFFDAVGLHNIGIGYKAEGAYDKAVSTFRDALRAMQDAEMAAKIRPLALSNLGAALSEAGRDTEALKVLRRGFHESRSFRFWRGAAIALSNLGDLMLRQGKPGSAEAYLKRSDRLIARADSDCGDLLFFNTFLRWKQAHRQHAPLQAQMLFGRLRELRSDITRWLPEVEQFDRHTSRHPGPSSRRPTHGRRAQTS